jgi:FkbM family methyltransferase
MPPIVSTRWLFAALLGALDVDTVCDVGSMDGADALRFRQHHPRANILAFEPNPENLARMQADERLRAQHIRVLPVAASDRDSEAPFFVVNTRHGPGPGHDRRGMSSLLRRADESGLEGVVTVRTVRLDRLLAEEQYADDALALWIDAEGMAFEVIRGADGVLANTRLLHVEVETTPCIGAHQHLFAEVRDNLQRARFDLLATDQRLDQAQFNALFVRRDLVEARAARIQALLALAWLRRRVGHFLRRVRSGN